jgi:hypothetical protein
MGVHSFLLCLKTKTTTLNSQSFNSFPISYSCFCLIFMKVDIVLMPVDLCKIMVVVLPLFNVEVSFLITPCNLLFHLFILRVFLLMQVLFVSSLLLFFCKFFPFFFYKEGLKEIQPPSQCFRPL